MEIRQLRYFLALAACQHFTRAADELHIGQSALSQQIKKLEEDYGVRLFRRSPTGVSLTPAGEAFLVHARQIISQVDECVQTLHRMAATGHATTINFGVMYSLILGPIDVAELLTSFAEEQPDVTVLVHEGTTESLHHLLKQGKIQAAILDLSLLDGEHALSHELVSDEPLIAMVSPDHPFAGRDEIDLAELANERLLQLATGSAARVHSIVRACKKAGFLPNFAMYPPNSQMARMLVSENMGVYLTQPWVAEWEGPPVKQLRLRGEPLRCQLALVWEVRPSGDLATFLRFAWPALNFRGKGVPKLTPPGHTG